MPEPIADPSQLKPGDPIEVDSPPADTSWFQAVATHDLQSHVSAVISRIYEDLGAKLLAADTEARKIGLRIEVVDWGTTSGTDLDEWSVKAWAKTRYVPLEES